MTTSDVIIIGAPRSGTNMLRDVLTRRPGVVTWPCDEINAVWRHGARDHPTDELPACGATSQQRRFVQHRFDRIRQSQGGRVVVEKTCANSLRLEYVSTLLPQARIVLITRDGVDAAASALDRWHAAVDWRYTARKVRFVPAGDMLHAAVRFATNRVGAGSSEGATKRVRSWGPRFEGIDEMIATKPLEEVCAAQWQRCVELSHRAADALPSHRVYRLTYEDFVQRPADGLAELLDFLELPSADLGLAVAEVSATSVGKGRSRLDPSQLARVEGVLAPTLEQLGYA